MYTRFFCKLRRGLRSLFCYGLLMVRIYLSFLGVIELRHIVQTIAATTRTTNTTARIHSKVLNSGGQYSYISPPWLDFFELVFHFLHPLHVSAERSVGKNPNRDEQQSEEDAINHQKGC